jgi:hypothetical protein
MSVVTWMTISFLSNLFLIYMYIRERRKLREVSESHQLMFERVKLLLNQQRNINEIDNILEDIENNL